MKKYGLLLLFIFTGFMAGAQINAAAASDSTGATTLKNVKVYARWKNDAERYHYNQMRFYVTTILPYLDAVTKIFADIDAKEQDPNISRKELKRYISTREDELRDKFEDHMDTLNTTQAVLLVKLIGRQTGVNVYHTVEQFKNPFAAIKWQGWACLNGINLNKKYDPKEEPDLESIMEELGYPLPVYYTTTADN